MARGRLMSGWTTVQVLKQFELDRSRAGGVLRLYGRGLFDRLELSELEFNGKSGHPSLLMPGNWNAEWPTPSKA